MRLSSPAFAEGDLIPKIYTCHGKNINPELHILGVPEGAKSLVLIMEDPDVPKSVRQDQMWNHWILFNIPTDVSLIATGGIFPGVPGMTTGGILSYEGPCPPDREHRYFFTLYALDYLLELPRGSTKEDVQKAMQGHIIASSTLMGRYG